ncbi:transposable element Tcb2 transposase [Trichonephila clavipes]|nr:transposable element Tcb2 transposase [Trichonephila clavipes]
MPLRHFRRQYEQLPQFERGRMNGMMEAGWSTRRLAHQLGRYYSVVRRCWDQWIQDVINTRRAPVSSRTIRRCRAEGHLESRHPLRVLLLTPTHRRLRLEWNRARGNWTAVEWNQVVLSDESGFNLSSDDNRVRVGRPCGERLNPA